MGLFWTIGKLRQQLRTTTPSTSAKRPPSWIQATAINNWSWELRPRSGRFFILGNWHQKMGHYWELETNTAAKRVPSWISATAINNGSFLDNWKQLRPQSGGLFWTTGINYGREAAAFLNSSNGNKYWIFFGQLETTTAAKRSLLELSNCHQ